MSIRAVVLRGPFSERDLVELAGTLRRIDARNPLAIFQMAAVDPDSTLLGEATQLMHAMLPSMEGRETVWTAAPTDMARWAVALREVLRRYGVDQPEMPMLAVIHDLFSELAKPEG